MVSTSPPIQAIFVPQGVEYKAVCQGVKSATMPSPSVIPIPIGPKPVTKYLERLHETRQLVYREGSRVLLMGLCGSLSASYSTGDIMLYQSCIYQTQQSALLSRACDPVLTNLISRKLKTSSVKALTSDRLIWSAVEKRQLGQQYAAAVVDMEGFAALEVFSRAGTAVGMVRVVSDGCDHNLPDLTSALSSDGMLQPLPLATGLLRHPIAAIRLIRGSLLGLKVLQQVTTRLFSQ